MVTLKDIQKNPYSVDVAVKILSTLIAKKSMESIKQPHNAAIKEELDNLLHEEKLIYRGVGTKQEQDNTYLKVFNEYGEMLKNESHRTATTGSKK